MLCFFFFRSLFLFASGQKPNIPLASLLHLATPLHRQPLLPAPDDFRRWLSMLPAIHPLFVTDSRPQSHRERARKGEREIEIGLVRWNPTQPSLPLIPSLLSPRLSGTARRYSLLADVEAVGPCWSRGVS